MAVIYLALAVVPPLAFPTVKFSDTMFLETLSHISTSYAFASENTEDAIPNRQNRPYAP